MNTGCLNLLLGGAALSLAACAAPPAGVGTDARAESKTEAPKRIGMPNPASVHCRDVGGTLVLQKQPGGGVIGLCTLADGTVCEEWALFRGECPAR